MVGRLRLPMQLKGLPLMRPPSGCWSTSSISWDVWFAAAALSDVLVQTALHRAALLQADKGGGKALLRATLLRIKRTRPQVGLRAKACEENVRDVFAIGKERDSDVLGKRLVLVGSQGGAQGGGRPHGFDLCKGSFRNYMTKRKHALSGVLHGTRHHLYAPSLRLLRARQVAAVLKEGRRLSSSTMRPSAPELRQEMLGKSNGRTTFPQIFIGEQHVGGCDDLYALDRAGELDPLLAA